MHADAAFLASILAAPDDDTPRLVYADWLEEQAGAVACPGCKGHGFMTPPNGWYGMHLDCHGTGRVGDGRAERAEFIRVQCELARRRQGPAGPVSEDSPWLQGDSRYQALRRRERELLLYWWTTWIGRMPAASPSEWMCGNFPEHNDGRTNPKVFFRRGFVEHVTCTAADWLAHGLAVVACQPVCEVTIIDAVDWTWHLAHPDFYQACKRLRRLNLRGGGAVAQRYRARWPPLEPVDTRPGGKGWGLPDGY